MDGPMNGQRDLLEMRGCILQDSHEIPRVIKDGVNCNKKTARPAAFAIGATGRFWVQYGLQGVNKRT